LGRKFRKNPTKAEKFLWQYLRNRQMDGEIYNLPHVKEYNIGKENTLFENGIQVARYKDEKIEHKISCVLESILNFITSTPKSPSPQLGEGDQFSSPAEERS